MDDCSTKMDHLAFPIPESESLDLKHDYPLKDDCDSSVDTSSIREVSHKKLVCYGRAIFGCLTLVLVFIAALFALYMKVNMDLAEVQDSSAADSASSQQEGSDENGNIPTRPGSHGGIPLSAIGMWAITEDALILGRIAQKVGGHSPKKTHLNDFQNKLLVDLVGHEPLEDGASIMEFFRLSKTSTPAMGTEYQFTRNGKLTVTKCGIYLISAKVPLRIVDSDIQVFFYVGAQKVSTCNRGPEMLPLPSDTGLPETSREGCTITTVRRICHNQELDLRVFSISSTRQVEIPLANKVPAGKLPNESMVYLSLVRLTA